MNMIMLVLDDPKHLDAVLDAWSEVGVTGTTIFETTGFYRRRAHPLGLRYWFATPHPASGGLEEGHFTLLAIVPDEGVVRRCLDATEGVVGDLDSPHTGIFSAWEVPIVKGLRTAVSGQGSDG